MAETRLSDILYARWSKCAAESIVPVTSASFGRDRESNGRQFQVNSRKPIPRWSHDHISYGEGVSTSANNYLPVIYHTLYRTPAATSIRVLRYGVRSQRHLRAHIHAGQSVEHDDQRWGRPGRLQSRDSLSGLKNDYPGAWREWGRSRRTRMAWVQKRPAHEGKEQGNLFGRLAEEEPDSI